MNPDLKNDLNNLARLAMIGCAGQAEPTEALYAVALACKRIETALTPTVVPHQPLPFPDEEGPA